MFYKKNRAKCLNCDELLISESTLEWVECTCGSLKIRGGKNYLERIGKNFKELSQIEIPEDIKETILEDKDEREIPLPPPLMR